MKYTLFIKTQLILSLLMYSSVSSSITAQEMGVITHTLTIANDNLSPFENDECCTLDEKEKKIMQQCAVDLCGMPSEVESAHITDVDFETKIKDEKIELDYQKFVPDLKKLVKNKTDKALATIVKVKKNMADNPDYFDFDKVDNKTASEIIEDEIRYKIDLKTIREEDGSKSIEFETREEETDEHILLLLEEYKTYRRDKIKNNFSYGIYDDYYTLEEGKKYLLGMLTAAVERFEKLKIEKPQIYNSNPSVFDDGLANVLLQKELINSETEIYNLTNMFYPLLSGHMLVNNMLSDGYVDYAVPSKSFECKNQAICKKVIENIINKFDFSNKVSEIEAKSKDTEKFEQLIKDCRYIWYESKIATPNKDMEAEFRKNIPLTKQKLKEQFINKYSSESQKYLNQYFADLKHHTGTGKTPDGRENDYLKELKDRVEGELELDEQADSEVTESYWAKSPQFFQDYKELKKFVSWEGEVELVRDLKNSCHDTIFAADDYFTQDEDGSNPYIHSSSFSCNHYGKGKQILAHELGHALSFAMDEKKTSKESYQQYTTMRSCISKIHIDAKEAVGFMSRHKGDTLYSEEDMGDYLAFKLYPNPNGQLLMCALVDQTSDRSSWKNPNVLNAEPLDPHSSPLLRLLMEAKYKNVVISHACKQVMEMNKDKIRFDTCE